MTTEDASIDAGLETEALQEEEAHRRLATGKGNTIPNEQVMAWLATWGSDNEIPPPENK